MLVVALLPGEAFHHVYRCIVQLIEPGSDSRSSERIPTRTAMLVAIVLTQLVRYVRAWLAE